jgi:pantothenate kinase-related protein Tda10
LTEALKAQILALLQLQTIDNKDKELEASIRALPQKLDPARRDLAKLESMVASERARLGETDTWRKQQEEALARDRDEDPLHHRQIAESHSRVAAERAKR